LDGVRELVVGTGGKSHYGLLDEQDQNYEVGNGSDFGVLRLDLGEDTYPTSERTPTHGSS
jgi:hypothetical protein